MDQILGLVGGRGIPSLSGGLEISLGSATQLRLWSSTSDPETVKYEYKNPGCNLVPFIQTQIVTQKTNVGHSRAEKLLIAIYK